MRFVRKRDAKPFRAVLFDDSRMARAVFAENSAVAQESQGQLATPGGDRT
jgi:hypothetical protein